MDKRKIAEIEEAMAAKRQRLGLTTGEDTVVVEGDSSQFLVDLYNIITTPGHFSDVTLEFKFGLKMEGHSVVLSAVSPYLKTLLSDKLREQSAGVLNLTSITKDAYIKLLEYIFHGVLKMKLGQDLEEVLQAARLLQVVDFIKKCGDCLEQRLSISCCLRTLHLAERTRIVTLSAATEKFVSRNLRGVSESADWSTLTEIQLTFLCRTTLRSEVNPETLAEAILKWLEKNRRDPAGTARVMKLFPMEGLPVEYISGKLMLYPAFLGNAEVLKILSEAIQSKMRGLGSPTPTASSSSSRPDSTSKATPKSYTSSLSDIPSTSKGADPYTPEKQPGGKKEGKARPTTLLVAGWSRSESVMYQWKWGSTSWDKITLPRHGLGAAMLLYNNQVFLTGGRISETSNKDGEQTRIVKYSGLATTSIVNLQSGKTIEENPMQKARSDHGMVQVGKSVYVAGGDNLAIEEYNNDRKTWSVAGKLNTRVKKCGVAAIDHRILVVGGSSKGSDRLVQVFDTRTGADAKLVQLLPMGMPEIRCAGLNQGKVVCLSREGKVVKIGGESDNYEITSTITLPNMTVDFDAMIRGQSIVVCTGHLKNEELRVSDSKRAVFLKYRLQDGKEDDCDIPSLPELLRVYGLAATRTAF